MKKTVKLIPFMLVYVIIISVFAGCGGSPGQNIVGTWVSESGNAQCIFYEDGKCDVPSELGGKYGEESYTIESNNMLKITDYYGSAITLTYVSLDKVDEYAATYSGSSNYQPWWCIDGNKIYFNSKDFYFTKQ